MAIAFAGIIYPEILLVSDTIEDMLKPLHYRSEERKYVHEFKNIQLGSIGKDFAFNLKKTIRLIFDGQIENRRELLKELEADPMLTNEELLILAYEKYGVSFLEKINGEFALVLLDQLKSTLLIARDPIGKKPLYWYHDKQFFLFSNELKSILATGIVPQTLSMDGIAAYLYFGYIPQDMSPIKDVNKLLPAHYLQFILGHGKRINQYWSYSSFFSRRIHSHKSTIVAELNDLITSAVVSRLPKTAEESGCFVSGGLGSAIIAYYLKRCATPDDIQAFSAGFKYYSNEDFEAAQTVCNSLNIPQEMHQITPADFLTDYAKIVWHLDEPMADPNVLVTWNLAALAANKTPYVFTGMGSDELLAGHSRYTSAERNIATVNRYRMLPKPLIKTVLIPFFNLFFPNLAFNILKNYRTNPWQFDYLRQMALFDEESMYKIAPKLAGYFDPETFIQKFHHLWRIQSNVSAFLYFDVKTRLPDCFIAQLERLTRAFGLSWQTPFLDLRIVEYAAALPEPEILLEEQAASYLKPLVAGVFPDSFINRPKKTRKSFLADWAYVPEIASLFQKLKKGTLVETGMISEKWLVEQLKTPDQVSKSFAQLFAILSLEVWFKIFITHSQFISPPNIPLNDLLDEN